MISLRHITTSFNPTTLGGTPHLAVDDVSLDIEKGSIHGIIGFSGAGKSTLLRNINLLERPTSGEVWVDGHQLCALTPEQLRIRRHHIGMIFQNFNLVNNLTTVQNVELSLKFAGEKSAKRRRTRALEALELVDMTERSCHYPAQLSGGQKQRAAIARAIATKPSVLLCDEPTSALDPLTTRTVLKYLAELNQKLGITIVLVTHQMEVLTALADEVTVLENGRIAEEFRVSELESGRFEPSTGIGKYLLNPDLRLPAPESVAAPGPSAATASPPTQAPELVKAGA